MNVLFLHQFDLNFAGGSGTYLRLVKDGLTAAGHTVEVVAATKHDRHGIATHALPFDFTMTFGPERRAGERTFEDFSIHELQELVTQAADSIAGQAWSDGTAPDLVVANHVSMQAEVARQLSTRFVVPYRVISYGTDGQLLEQDERYVTWLMPAAAEAEKVFAISQFVASQVSDVLGGIDTQVLGGAVDPDIFYPAKRAPEAARIAFVGRLVSEKGIAILIEAVAAMNEEIHLDVIGEGPLLDELRRTTPSNISFCGYLEPHDIRERLIRCSALVVPSLWDEPLGLVVLEAMACGVPVIATSVGGIPEIVEPEHNGILVEPNDTQALADAITRIVADRVFQARLVSGCRDGTEVATPAELAMRVLR